MLIDYLPAVIPGCTGARQGDSGQNTSVLVDDVWREPTQAELDAATAYEQQKQAHFQEATTARDDAKRALAALDMIIATAPTATTAQMRTGMEQMGRILKHLILATVGR